MYAWGNNSFSRAFDGWREVAHANGMSAAFGTQYPLADCDEGEKHVEEERSGKHSDESSRKLVVVTTVGRDEEVNAALALGVSLQTRRRNVYLYGLEGKTIVKCDFAVSRLVYCR